MKIWDSVYIYIFAKKDFSCGFLFRVYLFLVHKLIFQINFNMKYNLFFTFKRLIWKLHKQGCFVKFSEHGLRRFERQKMSVHWFQFDENKITLGCCNNRIILLQTSTLLEWVGSSAVYNVCTQFDVDLGKLVLDGEI